MARSSKYAMVSMDDAMAMVRDAVVAYASHAAAVEEEVSVVDPSVVGRVTSGACVAPCAVPPTPCSRLDGYAVHTPSTSSPGVYPVVQHRRAGHDASRACLPEGAVSWITTGASLPPGADAVVPVEYTTDVDSGVPAGSDARVRIDRVVAAGHGVRPAGSDIQPGDVLVAAGVVLTPAHVATLLGAGITTVRVVARPGVAVVSTGDEVVDAGSGGASARGGVWDTNRPMLLSLVRAWGAHGVDGGVVADEEGAVRDKLCALAQRHDVDVIVTTGGVSMGDRDLVKPMLAALGTVHFGRLNMKPGKPATFATLPRGSAAGARAANVLVFALPGNPVSAWVCSHLLVSPTLRTLSGMAWERALPTRVDVTMLDGVAGDGERPEFHRAHIWAGEGGSSGGALYARSTGPQASSRLQSVVGANGLLWLPMFTGYRPAPFSCQAVLLDAILPAASLPPELTDVRHVRNQDAGSHADGCGCGMPHIPAGLPATTLPPSPATTATSSHPSFAHAAQATTAAHAGALPPLRVCILTVSDRCHRGEAEDRSGPRLGDLVPPLLSSRFQPACVARGVVPDDMVAIHDRVAGWLRDGVPHEGSLVLPDLIVTTGGTGMGVRDVTPEALRPLITRPAHGLVHAMLAFGCTKTPLAALSRYEAGAAGRSDGGWALLVQMPGSVKAVEECVAALATLLPHALQLLRQA